MGLAAGMALIDRRGAGGQWFIMDFAPIYRDLLPLPVASPVSVLFCGFGPLSDTGAWRVRAEQIAARRTNWTAIKVPTEAELKRHDIICFVKKPSFDVHDAAKRLGKMTVYDVVDGWNQPEENNAANTMGEARRHFSNRWQDWARYDAHIFANRRMWEDLSTLSRCPTYIYHHSNPELTMALLRETAQIVGYQGAEEFLGEWRPVIEEACTAHGLRFVVNPDDYSSIDIGFAVRSAEWGGYLPSTYKSNVKVANFMATGTPCLVGSGELSYHEVAQGGISFFSTPDQLRAGLAGLLPLAARQAAREKLLAAAPEFAIDHIVDLFEHLFETLWQRRQAGTLLTAAA